MPVGHILVGDSRCDIKHDDTALAIDIVSVTKTSKLLLPCSIPDIKLDVAQILRNISILQNGFGGWRTCCAESEGMDLNSKCSDVLLLELSSQVAFDKSGLSKG